MDPITTALVNLGGGFVTAAVLFWLYRDARQMFREELAAFRTATSAEQSAMRAVFSEEQREERRLFREALEKATCRAPQYPLNRQP